MLHTNRLRLGLILPSFVIVIFFLIFFLYESDPLAPFVTECENTDTFVAYTSQYGDTVHRRVLHRVEKVVIIGPQNEVHYACFKVDSGTTGMSIDKRVAKAWKLKEQEGVVTLIRSGNGLVKRKSVEAHVFFAGQFFEWAKMTTADRNELDYVGIIGTKYFPERTFIDPKVLEED